MPELYAQLGLTSDEYDRICVLQGREPTHVELAVYSLMWSEHCGYKHSRPVPEALPHHRAAACSRVRARTPASWTSAAAWPSP